MILATLFLAGTLWINQDAPVDIPHAEVPKKAVCVVCSSGGEAHGAEKPAAGIRYKGAEYFFCNSSELAEFKKDPEAFLPPILPRPAPKLAANLLSGQPVALEDFRGKVVLIDFWATWCAPCVKSMPQLERLSRAYKDKGLVVLGVSIDEEPSKVAPFVAKRNLTYPILLDNPKSPSWANFRVRSVPMLFLVSRDGQIIRQWSGEAKMKEVDSAVAKAVAG